MFAKIVWFTGLSGSGKTTLSKKLYKNLKKKKLKCLLIDGDVFRKENKLKNSFSKKNIIENNLNIINFINKIKKKYDFVIVSVISPLLKTRKYAKLKFKEDYIEVFVKCKLSILKKRDTKGLYKLADHKKINNLIGYKSRIEYEKSSYKKLSIQTDKDNEQKCLKKILKHLFK